VNAKGIDCQNSTIPEITGEKLQ